MPGTQQGRSPRGGHATRNTTNMHRRHRKEYVRHPPRLTGQRLIKHKHITRRNRTPPDHIRNSRSSLRYSYQLRRHVVPTRQLGTLLPCMPSLSQEKPDQTKIACIQSSDSSLRHDHQRQVLPIGRPGTLLPCLTSPSFRQQLFRYDCTTT